MQICLVSQDYPPETARGGIGTQTWNKARALADVGHTVHVLSCAGRPGHDLRTEIDAGVTIHRIQPPGQEREREFDVFTPVAYSVGYTWTVLRHLRRLSQSIHFDLIDFPDYGAEGFAFQLDRVAESWIPVVVQLHAPLALLADHIGWPAKDSNLYRVGAHMEGVSITLADGLMSCSANIADFVASFYGVCRDSIEVVHCGVDTRAFCVGNHDGPERRPTVLFVGNVAPSKGIETAFKAVMRLHARYPDILLRVVGTGDEGLIARLRSEARSAGAESNVEFCGFVGRGQLPAFYQRADVFCSPAQYEGGVANVLLEAMACGCPVVASSVGGSAEAVVHGETGLLVSPGDVGGTVAALDCLLSDAGRRVAMGTMARQRVETRFAMDPYIERVLSVYARAVRRSREKLQQFETSPA